VRAAHHVLHDANGPARIHPLQLDAQVGKCRGPAPREMDVPLRTPELVAGGDIVQLGVLREGTRRFLERIRFVCRVNCPHHPVLALCRHSFLLYETPRVVPGIMHIGCRMPAFRRLARDRAGHTFLCRTTFAVRRERITGVRMHDDETEVNRTHCGAHGAIAIAAEFAA